MLREMFSRIAGTLRRGRLEDEFDAEVEDHLNLLAGRFIRNGMPPAEAYYAARRQFGGVTQMKEQHRERRALPPVDILVQDLRHAARQLRHSKWFTLSAAFTLALGIGAATAIFAVLDAVVLKPLPFAEPDRLMAFRPMDRRGGPHPTSLSYPNFLDFRAQNRVFEHLVSYRDSRFTLSDAMPAIQVGAEIVSWDLFPLLGIQPELGRGFLPEEEKPGARVVILSHALWQSRFGADPAIAGKQSHINGRLYTVVGVAPPGFHFPVEDPTIELWTTLAEDSTVSEFTPLSEQRGARVMDAIARLKRGVTPLQAQAQMDQIAGALAREYPDDDKNVPTTSVVPELDRLTKRSGQTLWMLLGAVSMVLLIACANVANLLLARGAERARDFALRTALGASRAALVRQLLAESFFLGLLGTIGGVAITAAALRFVLPLAGDDIPIPRFTQSSLDLRVLAFSVAAALATILLFSLAPAVQVLRTAPIGFLKEAAANIVRGRHRLRSGLVVCQITLGLVLLVGAELLMASFLYLLERDPGFRPDHLLTFEVGLSDARYNNAAQIAFCDRLLERLGALPGVRAAVTGEPLPLDGDQMSVSFDIEERPAPPPDRPHSDIAIVTPGYFSALGIPVLKGREFTAWDDTHGPRVTVVNEAFARKFFPRENVLGKRIQSGAYNGKEGPVWREIVGVVKDAKQSPFTVEPDPIYYFPFKQLSWGVGTIVLRTAGPPLTFEPAARAALMSLDREAPMYRVRTGEQRTAAAVALPRFLTVLMACFAGIALMLTVVGLYGLLSYTVARRRREIGVRIALGAGRTAVVVLVLREAVLLVAAGLALGLAAAAAAQRLLKSFLFGVQPGNPAFLAMAGGLIVLASLAAAYLPAWRATSINPIQALRTE